MRLADRGVVAVGGADAAVFLQNLLTNDIAHLTEGDAAFAGLLSPQGKILFDFIVVRRGDTFLLDVSREATAALIKRLTLYRLRAAVSLSDLSETENVFAMWDGNAPVGATDPRSGDLGRRWITSSYAGEAALAETYHNRRIALGVPEGGKDYDYGDTYPHEALYDRLNGVSFDKGCYVGQEIVSRMEHRATVKKRVVPVTGADVLPTHRPEILLGDVPIGKLGSVAARSGLALVRVDRIAEATSKGMPITVEGQLLTFALPVWALPSPQASDTAARP